MQLLASINVLLAPIVMLVLILIDYGRTRVTDQHQRHLFFMIIGFTLIAILSQMLYDIFAGLPGRTARLIVWGSNFFYYLFQVSAYFKVIVFIDYNSQRNWNRVKRFSKFINALLALHVAILLLNFRYGFYYDVTPDNYYRPGVYYIIRLIFSYAPVAISFINLIFCRKSFGPAQAFLMVFFAGFTTIGATIDLIFRTGSLVWPCFCSALLFSYFFIIRRESCIDELTGIENRRGCEEYLATLSRSGKRRNCGFLMIDIDRFKSINDNYGHRLGDQALCEVAGIIKKSIRRSDFAARYGGDEFLIITHAEQRLDMILMRIHSNVAEFNRVHKRPYTISLSIGCDVYHTDSDLSPSEFLDHVDRLMYQNKEERRHVPNPDTDLNIVSD